MYEFLNFAMRFSWKPPSCGKHCTTIKEPLSNSIDFNFIIIDHSWVKKYATNLSLVANDISLLSIHLPLRFTSYCFWRSILIHHFSILTPHFSPLHYTAQYSVIDAHSFYLLSTTLVSRHCFVLLTSQSLRFITHPSLITAHSSLSRIESRLFNC